MQEFEQFLQEIGNHIDDREWLSKEIVTLSALYFQENMKAAEAKFNESRIVVSYISQAIDGKRMAVSEAERRANMDTQNTAQVHEKTAESILVMIEAMKVRISEL